MSVGSESSLIVYESSVPSSFTVTVDFESVTSTFEVLQAFEDHQKGLLGSIPAVHNPPRGIVEG